MTVLARVLRGTLSGFYRQQGFFLAAGISFYVIICVAPLAFLLVAAAGFLLTDERAVEDVVAQLTEYLPVYRVELEEILLQAVRARRITGLLGTGIFLLFASQLFAALRLVLNRVLGVPKGRGFLHGAAFDLWMLLLVTLLFFLSMAVTAVFAWAKAFLLFLRQTEPLSAIFEAAELGLVIVFDTLMFCLLYRFVPARRPPWRFVLISGAATAALWELAKQLFRWYILSLGVYSEIYGSLGVLVALFMWIYYSAVVFVLGAALIRALEASREGVGV